MTNDTSKVAKVIPLRKVDKVCFTVGELLIELSRLGYTIPINLGMGKGVRLHLVGTDTGDPHLFLEEN